MSISIDYQLKMMESIAHIMEKIDEKESGKFTKEQINEDLKGVLSDLKSLATKAQKQWEKTRKSSKRENVDLSIEEAKFDDPPVDYGGYDIEDPNAKYAARHFKPTDSLRQRKKREIQSQIEQLLKRAPDTWLEKTMWTIIPLEGKKMWFYDRRNDNYYAYPSGRPISKYDIGYLKSDEELEDLLKAGKAKKEGDRIVVTETSGASDWLKLILVVLGILLKAIWLVYL